MLYLSLVLSLLLVLFANLAVHRPKICQPIFFVCGIVFTFGPIGMLFLPPVAMTFLGLALAMIPWRYSTQRPWRFFPLSCLAFMIAFGVAAWFAWEAQREYARLRAKYPLESLEERLPAARPTYRLEKMPAETDQRLEGLEDQLRKDRGRSFFLSLLHEGAINRFVNSPGFGVTRMFIPTEKDVSSGLPLESLLPQPIPRTSAMSWPEDMTWDSLPWDESLSSFHRDGLLDFVNPMGFGFFKDRAHVAGFRPHQFSDLPKPAERWSLQRLELIGLLLHQEPRAYVSDHLPRMDELRGAPTRPLDRFEASGLERLRRGEDLVIGGATGGIRMLGTLRSAKQCVECHGGERGDLLGAFSYVLKRSEP